MIRVRRHHSERGSVVLIALCFVAILGIALASYLAVSNQAMKLSNRSLQQSVSRQLAEMGLEQTLWSFNRNDWDPAVWTLSGTTATRTIVSPIAYGNGISGSIKVRVDNYDAYNRPSAWASAINYRIGDVVSFTNGMWYRCLQAHSNIAPAPTNLSYWAEAPIPWMWNSNTSYKEASPSTRASVVFNGSTWYLCNHTHTSSGTTFSVGAYPDWKSATWNNSTTYSIGDFAFSSGIWYCCIASHSNQLPPDPSVWSPRSPWEHQVGFTYNFDDVVFKSGPTGNNWYRCISTSTTSTPPSSDWQKALDSWLWDSNISYNLNEVVYYAGGFYRCILAHTNRSPSNTRYWSPDPLRLPTWDPGRQYEVNDVVNQNGAWYLCTVANYGKNPATTVSPTSYWDLAPQYLAEWSAAKNYGIGDVVSSSGTWYRCVAAHTNQAVSTTTYWFPISGATRQWNSSTSYTTASYVSYGGVWYHCIVANVNQTPNNSTYWKALGTPIIYAEGSATLPDGSAPLKTQLRATVTKAPLFPNAIAATSTVTINDAGTVDSYDGSLSTRSSQGTDTVYTYGQFSNPFSSTIGGNNISSSAVLASTATSTTAVSIGNATVRGYVAAPSATTSPYAPLWNYAGSAMLAGLPTGTGIDLSRASRSPYIPQFDSLPKPDLVSAFIGNNFAKGTLLATGTSEINIGTPGAVTPSRYYYNPPSPSTSLDLGTGYPIVTLNINGPVVLYINGRLRIHAGGQIDIKTSGSLEIHCSSLRTDQAGGGIYNRTQDPKKLTVIIDSNNFWSSRLENNTRPTGDFDFCGLIYAPKLTSTLGFEIRTGVKILGAISARKVTFSSEPNFHYDTSLRSTAIDGVDSPFVISEWRELTEQTEKPILP